MAASDFQNLRWFVTEEVTLSMSSWKGESGFHQAVALLRRGKVDSDTAREYRYRKEWQSVQDREPTCYGYDLVTAILGDQTPLRFFRDNFMQNGKMVGPNF